MCNKVALARRRQADAHERDASTATWLSQEGEASIPRLRAAATFDALTLCPGSFQLFVDC
jgi:hypothetical protein